MMGIEEMNSIEIGICRFRCSHAEYLGSVRLYPTKNGFGVYAREPSPTASMTSGICAAWSPAIRTKDFWLLVEKAMAWAAGEMEGQ